MSLPATALPHEPELSPPAPREPFVIPPPVLTPGQVLFRTLGAAEIHVGGGPVIMPSAERSFSLLVLCAMSPDQVLPREQLLELVWPDLDPEGARHSLRQHLYKLRSLGVALTPTRTSVGIAPGCLVPCFALGRTSALFEQDVLRGREPFGHLFAGWIPSHAPMRHWVEQQRDRFNMDVRRVLVPEVHRLRDRADWPEVERWARTVLEFDPYNEEATLSLAESLAMQGGRASARYMLDGYAREVGDLGADLARHVEATQRRIGRAGRVRHEHAATPTLIGRDEELAQLDAMTMAALRGETQVVHLLGPPGIGKTELAYEATRRAVILGFTRCIVRVTRPMGEVPHGMLSRLVRDLLKLPGALGCPPNAVAVLEKLADDRGNVARANPSRPKQVAESLTELFQAVVYEAPLLLFIDDVHNCDSLSLETIEQAVVRAHRYPMLVVFTRRTAAMPHGRPLLSDHPTHADAKCLSIFPLTHESSVELAAQVKTSSGRTLNREAATIVASASDRTPLEIITLAREHLLTGITSPKGESLGEMLVSQVKRLPPMGRALLGALAALGGRSTSTDLADVVSMPVGEVLASLATLLDSGLAHEQGGGHLWCHDEVTRAALASMRDSELSLLRSTIAKQLDGVLANQFDPERACIALSAALDSGNRALYVDLCLKYASGLKSQWALRFLETAYSFCESTGHRRSVLAELVRTATTGSEWHRVLLASTELSELEDAEISVVEPDIHLARLEALVHSSSQTSGHEAGHAALSFAHEDGHTASARLRAARIALVAASELFVPQLGIGAFSVIRDGLIADEVSEESLNETLLQYHTIFGCLRTGVLLAKDLSDNKAQLLRTPEGVRRLLNASLSLRIGGACGVASGVLDACEQECQGTASAAVRLDISWRRCVHEIECGTRDSAISRGKVFRTLAALPDAPPEKWIRLFLHRLDLVEFGDVSDFSLPLETCERAGYQPSRLVLYCAALCLNSSKACQDQQLFERLVTVSSRWVTEFGRYSGMDFFATSAISAIARSNDLSAARELLQRYFGVDRRELSQPGIAIDSLPEQLKEEAHSAFLSRVDSATRVERMPL